MLAPLSRLLLDLHPALLLLLLLDFLLLILLLTPFVVSGFGVVGAAAVQLHEQMPVGPRGSIEDKASVSDITIAPFPRRAPPVKSFVAVPNKSLVQVVSSEGVSTLAVVRSRGGEKHRTS